MTIVPDAAGRCPHCRFSVRFEVMSVTGHGAYGNQPRLRLEARSGQRLDIAPSSCPECGRPIIVAVSSYKPGSNPVDLDTLVWPNTTDRPVPKEIEADARQLAADFREAVAVFAISKKASAALARRCLQFILVTKAGAKTRDLSTQIDEVLPSLPLELGENVDAIRHVGNFAAHPLKSTSTGQIIDVEEGEAEWLIDVLEDLFQHFYVAPARAAERRAAFNRKLSDLGKPPLKKP